MIHEPNSVDAERELLATCLQFPEVVAECQAEGISESVFYDPKHAMAWSAIVALAGNPGLLDAGTLLEELRRRDQLSSVGGEGFILEISSFAASSLRKGLFIRRILDLWKQRKVIAAGTAMVEAASEAAVDWPEVWERVEPHLQRALSAGASTSRRSIADIAHIAADCRLRPEIRPLCPTPWPEWNRFATPPRAGELIVIAARPGVGKTTLAGNIAADAAASGQTIAFFSREMAAEQVVDRWALRRAGRNGIGNDQFAHAHVVERIREIGRQRNIHLLDGEACKTLAQIEAQCRLLAASPEGLSLVAVDYLQLVLPPAESMREHREQQVALMARRFKLLANSLNCPVFLLAQLNRESEKEDRRPRLSDLRESGSIEQDADRVWFLYRHKPADHEPLPVEEASIIKVALYQAKCRNGPAEVEAILNFHRPCFSFFEGAHFS